LSSLCGTQRNPHKRSMNRHHMVISSVRSCDVLPKLGSGFDLIAEVDFYDIIAIYILTV
jgi:hypothetical protein